MRNWRVSSHYLAGFRRVECFAEVAGIRGGIGENTGSGRSAATGSEEKFFWLTPQQVVLLNRFFPTPCGVPRMDNLRGWTMIRGRLTPTHRITCNLRLRKGKEERKIGKMPSGELSSYMLSPMWMDNRSTCIRATEMNKGDGAVSGVLEISTQEHPRLLLLLCSFGSYHVVHNISRKLPTPSLFLYYSTMLSVSPDLATPCLISQR